MFDTRNAVFRQGHFYDTQDNLRIELHEGTQVCLVAQRGGFRERQIIGQRPDNYRTSEQMLAAVQQLPSFWAAWPLAKAGDELFFGFDNKKHIFRVTLREDLFLYNCTNWKDPTDLYLFDCACEVVENINQSLKGFESVYGMSLNDLYKTAYVHYLQNKGNASRNAVTVFYRDADLYPASKLEKDKEVIQKDLRDKLGL